MFLKAGELLVKGYGVLLTVAVGGFVGANCAGFMPAAIEFTSDSNRAPDPEFVRSWIHAGWIAGVGLFAFGTAAQKLRPSRKRGPTTDREGRGNPGPDQRRLESKPSRVTSGANRYGVLGSIGVGGLIGGFLGLMLGGSFLLLWFSVAYSPFAPDGWASSVSTERVGIDTARPRDTAATTNHPVALYAFFGPIGLGAAAGAMICGGIRAVESWKKADEHDVASQEGEETSR